MQVWLILEVLVLLALANGTPVAVNKLLGQRWAYPIDGGVTLFDGRPLFGASKTLRGVVFCVLVTAAGALVMGLGWKTGAAVGALAMVGDLFSSFLKRRMGLVASSRATGLDQIPEALFPLLICRGALWLTAVDIGVVVAVFFVGEVLLSILFYRLHLRERPY
jgi:CDP-diglyceride synthetase